jgi:hypothetical protein
MAYVGETFDKIFDAVLATMDVEGTAEVISRWAFELKIYTKTRIHVVSPVMFFLFDRDESTSSMEKWVAMGKRLGDYGPGFFEPVEEPFRGKNLGILVSRHNAETMGVLRETRAKVSWVQAAMWGRSNKQVGFRLQFKNAIVIGDKEFNMKDLNGLEYTKRIGKFFEGLKFFEMQYQGASTLENSWPSLPDRFATKIQDEIRDMINRD